MAGWPNRHLGPATEEAPESTRTGPWCTLHSNPDAPLQRRARLNSKIGGDYDLMIGLIGSTLQENIQPDETWRRLTTLLPKTVVLGTWAVSFAALWGLLSGVGGVFVVCCSEADLTGGGRVACRATVASGAMV